MVKISITLVCASLLVLSCRCSAELSDDTDPVVETKKGTVVGRHVETENGHQGFSFQGIPFGDPPVGNLRFQPPQPRTAWNDNFIANHSGPGCVAILKRGFQVQSEDCLSLDVHAPVQNLTGSSPILHPVMFYLFGGDWEFGSTADYKAETLIDHFVRRGVVVVVINYRSNVFGFFSTGTDDVRGNAGLHDMILGLKWVRDEIEAFGGDPNHVTLMGESSGASAVSVMTLSPLARGLYHQALQLSGTMFDPGEVSGPTDNLDMNRNLVENLGCNRNYAWQRKNFSAILKCMENITSEQLLFVYYQTKVTALNFDPHGPTGPRQPTRVRIDGVGGAFPEDLATLAAKRDPIPVLMGTVTHEVASNTSAYANPDYARNKCNTTAYLYGTKYAENIAAACEDHYVNRFESSTAAPTTSTTESNWSRWNPFWPNGRGRSGRGRSRSQNRNHNRRNRDKYANLSADERKFWSSQMNAIINDADFYAPVFKDASLFRSIGSPAVYLYEFGYNKDGASPQSSPSHAEDIMYILGFPPYYDNYTARDAKMGDIYSEIFSNFIRGGNPTPNGSRFEPWAPLASPVGFNYYKINITNQSNAEYYHVDAVQFWNDVVGSLVEYASNSTSKATTLALIRAQLQGFALASSNVQAAVSDVARGNPMTLVIGLMGVIVLALAAVVAVSSARKYYRQTDPERTRLLESYDDI